MHTPRLAVVTPQQRAVIRELAADGASNSQIGDRLGITEDTVKSHLKAALARTGCPNRTALVCALLRRQVVLRTTNRRWDDDEAAA